MSQVIQSPRNITPPDDAAPRYPYRRVWISLGIEQGILFLLAVAALFLANRLVLSPQQNRILTSLIALLPFTLWLIFSWFPERFAEQPRPDLLKVAVISALAANAIGVPLINQVLSVDQWIDAGSNVNRILAATVTIGVVPEVIKYFVVRNLAWRSYFRNWVDSIAYCIAAAVGYTTVLALQYVFIQSPAVDIAIIRVFGIAALQTIGSVITAYGMSETRFSRPIPLFMTAMIGVGSLIIGITRTLRGNFTSPRLTLDISYPRNIIGVVFVGFMVLAICFIISFLFVSTERIALEAEKSQEVR